MTDVIMGSPPMLSLNDYLLKEETRGPPLSNGFDVHKVLLTTFQSQGDGGTVAAKEISLSIKETDRTKEVANLDVTVRLLMNLSHTNIVKFLGRSVFRPSRATDKPTYRIIMKYYTGGPLAGVIDENTTAGKQLSKNQIHCWGTGILSGLKYLHDNNIAHKTLHANHIVFEGPKRAEGNVKLVSLGRISEILPNMNRSYVPVPPSTVALFEPPEIREWVGSKTDIFCFGGILIYMTTGYAPNKLSWSEETVTSEKIAVLPREISPELEPIIRSCLKFKYNERPSAEILLKLDYFNAERLNTNRDSLQTLTESSTRTVLPIRDEDLSTKIQELKSSQFKVYQIYSGMLATDAGTKVLIAENDIESVLQFAEKNPECVNISSWSHIGQVCLHQQMLSKAITCFTRASDFTRYEELLTEVSNCKNKPERWNDLLDYMYTADKKSPEAKRARVAVQFLAEYTPTNFPPCYTIFSSSKVLLFTFRPRAFIGQGAFGNVFAGIVDEIGIPQVRTYCEAVKSNRLALKVMFSHGVAKSAVEPLLSLEDKNVVKYIFIGNLSVDQSIQVILMEFCAGGTLNDVAHTKPTVEQILFYMRQVAAGLKYIHGKGMAHRDIKGENLLLSDDRETVKIGDLENFSALKDPTKSLTERANRGTFQYMSPEMFLYVTSYGRTERPNEATDVYSVGCVMLELCNNGTVPQVQIVRTQPDGFSHGHSGSPTDWPDVSKADGRFRAIVEKCLHPTPDQRINTDVLLADLMKC